MIHKGQIYTWNLKTKYRIDGIWFEGKKEVLEVVNLSTNVMKEVNILEFKTLIQEGKMKIFIK